MTNVVNGNYRTTPELAMRAFDKLPPTARHALAYAIEDWVPQPILTRHNKQRPGYETGAEIAQSVARWDREELAKREHQRARAVGPYKGNAPDPGAVKLSRRPRR